MNIILGILVGVIVISSFLFLAMLIYLSHNDAINIRMMGPFLVDRIKEIYKKLRGKKTDEI